MMHCVVHVGIMFMNSNTDSKSDIVWPMTEERKKELIRYCYPEIYKRLFPDDV